MVQFLIDGENKLYPSRLLGFVQPNGGNEDQEWEAIVQSTVHWDEPYSSVCVHLWDNEMDPDNEEKPMYRSVPVGSLDGVVFMMNKTDQESICILPINAWADKFTTFN